MRETRYPLIRHHSTLITGLEPAHPWVIDDFGYISPVCNIPPFMEVWGLSAADLVPPIIFTWLDQGYVEDVTTIEESCPVFTLTEFDDYDGTICEVFIGVAVAGDVRGFPENYFVSKRTPGGGDDGGVETEDLLVTNDWVAVLDLISHLTAERDGYEIVDVTMSLTSTLRLHIDPNLNNSELYNDIKIAIFADGIELLIDNEIEIVKVDRAGMDITTEIKDEETHS